jgi:hypothetical protein
MLVAIEAKKDILDKSEKDKNPRVNKSAELVNNFLQMVLSTITSGWSDADS